MRQFKYKYGDRPLEGYTIERAAGHGGFGEVYYAVSDSGRQVAIKAVQSNVNIELRGIKQCMNLKSPHLVSIFDVKYSDNGKPFVIMEYVAGPSLADLIKESPGGLGTQKAAFFLREIAKGLSFLHECGIVHRDLKPGNIFYENGCVKIGDYGLSKAISANHNSGQTITVGTVHYMAPEIGAGRYDRSIDIYSLGVLLYEMLTGQVPFFGASPGEVLMKHISAAPELDGIDETFARVIRKSMEKDPDNRYTSVQEMVEDVFGAEHIRNSVSQFSPESLSIVAEQVAKKARVNVESGQTYQRNRRERVNVIADRLDKAADRFDRAKEQVNSRVDFVADRINNAKQQGWWKFGGFPEWNNNDPLTRGHKVVLFFLSTLVISLGGGLFGAPRNADISLISAFVIYILIAATTWLIHLSRWRFYANMDGHADSSRWALVGLTASIPLVFGMLFSSYMRFPFPFGITKWSTLVVAVFSMCLMNWWKVSSPDRQVRISLGKALIAGLVGFIAGKIGHMPEQMLACVFAGISLGVQISSPFRKSQSSYRPQKRKPAPKPRAAAASSIPRDVSPYKRMIALLLSGGMFFSVFGLQRFYVGKIGTGIVWLFTFGCFGIGQLIDVILIIAGQFKDKQGRTLRIWEDANEISKTSPAGEDAKEVSPPTYSDKKNSNKTYADTHEYEEVSAEVQPEFMPPSVYRQPFSLTAFLLAVGGYLLLFGAMIIGLAIAVHLPAIISAGFPDESISRDFKDIFGTSQWPDLMESLGRGISVALLVIATVTVTVARRRNGPAHMIRAIISSIGFIITYMCFYDGFPRHYSLMTDSDSNFGIVLNNMVSKSNPGAMYPGLIIFVVSVLILAWPVKTKEGRMLSTYYSRGAKL